MTKRIKPILALLITIALYVLFLKPVLKYENFFWDSDAEVKHYPTREFLYRSLINEHRFPLYTERVLFGHALYQDMENAYLNPINVLSILIAGPVISFKLLHFFTVLVGGFALYKLLERKGANLLGYTAACLVYFFSFFHLNHLIHFNLISISLLLPLNVLLVDLFSETKHKRYLVFQGLLLGYGILWGHPQTTLLVFLAITIYTLILKAGVKPLAVSLLIAISVGLPQIIPSTKAYLASARNIDNISASQGSLTPALSVSYLFPYIYSTATYYYGEDINEDFSYTELYNYLGIAAITLFAFYILFGKKDTEFYFSYGLLVVFLILGYLKYIPLIHLENFPLVSSFRYWNRSIFLFAFGLALIIGKLFNKDEIKLAKPNKHSVLLLVSPLLYLLLLTLFNLQDSTVTAVHNSLLNYRFEVMQRKEILTWLALPFVTLTLVAVYALFQSSKYVHGLLRFLLVATVFFDYWHFAPDVLDHRINKWNWESGLTYPFYYNGHRAIEEKVLVKGMKPLLREVYTPYGYTQFVDEKYLQFFTNNHLGKSVRASFTEKLARPELDFNQLKTYGITYVRTGDMEYRLRDPAASSFLRDELQSSYLILKDGHIKMKVDSPTEELFTTIKYDSNWIITVNDKRVSPEKWDEMFIKLGVNQGENVVEFKYTPYDIYVGAALGAVLLFVISYKMRHANKSIARTNPASPR